MIAIWFAANSWLATDPSLNPELIVVPGGDLDFAAGDLTPSAQQLRYDSAAELERELDALSFDWPPAPRIPMVEVHAMPADINDLPVKRKKSLFFRSLLPIVLAENRRLQRQRDFLQNALSRLDELSEFESRQLRSIAQLYRVDGEIDDPNVQARLLRRVDTIPVALVLAQAANESGWGTSRFVRQGNNLFGMWTYDPRRGLTPSDRREGARHSVRAYRHLRDSVRHYLLTLNVLPAYRELRALREQQRGNGRELDAIELAQGLLRYSERGAEYVEEIRKMIRGNRLEQINKVELATG